MIFVCPKCGGALFDDGESCRCPLGHSFDKAKEGYLHLLLGAGAGTHGDNKEMVDARRAFLDTGAYEFLAEEVAAIAAAVTPTGALLDFGCGEGYYTERIRNAAAEEVTVAGFDISKDAVKRAAKRLKGKGKCEFAVASGYHLPLADGSVSTVVNLFSPLVPDEVLRVLRPGGCFLLVFPEKEHLYGLKQAVYDTPYYNVPAPTELAGFSLIFDKEMKKTVTLTEKKQITSLFRMTPYCYRTSVEGRTRVENLTELTTDFDFRVLVYRKA